MVFPKKECSQWSIKERKKLMVSGKVRVAMVDQKRKNLMVFRIERVAMGDQKSKKTTFESQQSIFKKLMVLSKGEGSNG